ncbi:glycoside hydrolase family 13 protein [Pseudocercospora fijiensis CIRAD86]|uniref:alpha-amylase n=1 Tax=Pseudocercospora fijiensis (strain CIRAD86) TaxID=383855 RepID=M2Z4M5_PSEFD|nr:glycoside hydrolase family 13 protein [Pseudocercospora fijiensis CIRAD86]EME84740.1 glycoside hydrolase family 13 protein [Pseudocercospora fijiensis CIRAD86]
MKVLWPLIILSFRIGTAYAATLEEWRGRTIYQVLTDRFARSDGSSTAACGVVDGLYCHGTWKGIIDKLDYIQGMNFDAIWISPVVAQLPQRTGDGEAYTGYWAQNLYSLNANFGSAEDLRALSDALHDRGMYLMLDIVVNHMGYAGVPSSVDYTILDPFNDERYFHPYCAINDNTNQTEVEVCWLGDTIVPLPDLRTEDEDVQDMLQRWISSMVSNYSIDGLRIDTAINVQPGFFPDFVNASGLFAMGETMMGDNLFVCRWARTIGSILNYPIYYPLIRAFSSAQGSINDLVKTIYTMRQNCDDPTTFGLFSENHDVERFAQYTNDTAQAKNLIAFTIMGDGIPIIYQGQEQHMAGGISPYINRTPLWATGYDTEAFLYKHIAKLVAARQHIVKTSEGYTRFATEVVYQDYHSFAMRKGKTGQQVITVLNNNGEDTSEFKLDIRGHDLESGTHVTELLSCTNTSVEASGILSVQMGSGQPKVYYPTHLLVDSGLCGMGKTATSNGDHSDDVMTTSTPTASKPAEPGHTRTALGVASHPTSGDAITTILACFAILMLVSSMC